jgi:death on curing protein
MRYLGLNDVLELYRQILQLTEGSAGIRNINLLESALAQPRVTFGSHDLHPTLIVLRPRESWAQS